MSLAMPAYFAPGTYLRPKRTDLPDVRIVRPDVAGFVGYAERGPLPMPSLARGDKPWQPEELAVRLTSWDEFRATFGGVIPNGYLAYAVRGFFENGGSTCHVVRVAGVDADDRAARPEFARWVFAAPGQLGAVMLGAPAVSGQRALTTSPAPAAGNAQLVEVAAPGGALFERHVLAEVRGAELVLASPLRGSYPAGSLVIFRDAALIVEATSAGSWGNRIGLRIQPSTPGESFDHFSLRITVDPGPDREHPREEEPYPRLSLDPEDTVAYIGTVVNARSRLVRIPLSEAQRAGQRSVPMARSAITSPRLRLEGGRDGLRSVAARSFGLFGSHELAGLQALEAIDQVSILCAPDAMLEPLPPIEVRPVPSPPCAPPEEDTPPIEQDDTSVPQAIDSARVYAEMLAQCERRHDRVAILDPPSALGASELLRWRSGFSSRFGATYAPWLFTPDPLQPPGSFRAIPPSGHVAGVYAMTDLTRGVHYPPANVILEGVADVVQPIGLTEQEALNPYGVNVLRAFPGTGVRVWGARSLAEVSDGAWRFIHVRRLLSMIEESVEDSMQWAAFEPNDGTLRRAIVHAVSLFLDAIWVDGGLKGDLPEEGFYVKCDETNNPQAVVDAGQLVCQVGVAPAAPMEFIVFELRQTPDGAEILEL